MPTWPTPPLRGPAAALHLRHAETCQTLPLPASSKVWKSPRDSLAAWGSCRTESAKRSRLFFCLQPGLGVLLRFEETMDPFLALQGQGAPTLQGCHGCGQFSSLFLNLFVEEKKNPYLHKPFLWECCRPRRRWDMLEFHGSAPPTPPLWTPTHWAFTRH